MFIVMESDDDDALFLIYDVARLMRVDADKRARAQGMTRAQWVVLIWLDRQPGLSQNELAEILDVEPISVARLVDRLAARGLVERRADAHDRRIWRLHLGPDAPAVLAAIACQRTEMRALTCAGVSPTLLDQTTQALVRLKANLTAERTAARPQCLPRRTERQAATPHLAQADLTQTDPTQLRLNKTKEVA
jgi:MarR family transcriptional regulator for hemolysin